MAADVQAVEAALASLRPGVQADGYDLSVESVDNGVARVRVVAGPDACEECLVPKPIMVGTLMASLKGMPEISRIDLRYPVDE